MAASSITAHSFGASSRPSTFSLTNKLHLSRDREPLMGIRNSFRELVFS